MAFQVCEIWYDGVSAAPNIVKGPFEYKDHLYGMRIPSIKGDGHETIFLSSSFIQTNF